MKNICHILLVFGWIILLFSGCTIKYPTSDDATAPVLSDFIVTGILYLQSNIDYPLSVRVSDPQGLDDIQHVIYHIYPLGQSVSIWEDTLQDQGAGGDIIPHDGLFCHNFSIDFVQGQAAQYRIEVVAKDFSNHLSNVLSDTLTVMEGEKNFPPILSNPVLSDTLTEVSLGNAFFSIQVDDSHGHNDVDSVFVQIYPSFNPKFYFHLSLRDDGLNGDDVSEDGVYSFLGDLSDTLRTIGVHLIRYQAVDQEGLVSQPIVASFYIDGINGLPVLSQLSMPDTVSRSLSIPFLISVRATDPQSLADVKRVYFNMIQPDHTPYAGNPVPLFDDGNYGDRIPGDGLYSLSVTMSTQTDKGIYQFDFFAEDYSGTVGDSLTHHLTIVN